MTQLLHWRADDVNAGVAQLQRQSNVRPNCTVIAGISHGGVVTLLSAGAAPTYQGAHAQAGGKNARFRQYPGLPGVERHGLMQPRYSSIWKPDVAELPATFLPPAPS
ncbi:MAG: hypothetical protein JOY61_06230 [Chloroflexi bacterium]|nr:hypothetical protein [Chloroflexota bacterium]